MPQYEVSQGECVESIACDHGLFWKTVWDDEGNKSLRQDRKSPNHLLPGDMLFVPELRLKEETAPTEQRNRYRVKGRLAKLLIRLLNFGDPCANIGWKATVAGREQEGTTDGDGNLEVQVHPCTASVVLVLDSGITFDLQLRHLDPIETLSGAQARLNNLGYEAGPVDGLDGPLTQAAARAFQADYPPLEVDGIIGPKTRAELEEVYGS